MAPAPDGVEVGQISAREQLTMLGGEVAQYMNAAITLVKKSTESLGFVGQPQVVCDTLLVDDGKFVHPVVTVIPDASKPGVSYAVGGQDFKDVYPVSGSTESMGVDWGKSAKNYPMTTDTESQLVLDSGELRVKDSRGQMKRNFMVKENVYAKLAEEDRPGVVDSRKVSAMEAVVKGLKAASGATNGQTA